MRRSLLFVESLKSHQKSIPQWNALNCISKSFGSFLISTFRSRKIRFAKVARSAVRRRPGMRAKGDKSYDKSRDEYLIAHFHVPSMSYWDSSTHRALQQLRLFPSFAAPSRSSTNANIYSTFFLASQSSTLRSSLRINLRNQLTSMCEMLKRHDNPSRRVTVQRFARVKTTGNRRTRHRKSAKNEIAAVRHFR